MGVDALTGTAIVVGVLGVAGLVADVVALVQRRGVALAWTGIALRLAGVLALVGLVVAGRGGPDFQDLVFALYGIFAGIALWFAAAITDAVLLIKHLSRKRGPEA